ncbi:MAG: LemA family protein [Nanoarchaeota archaeon]|nr:LemA family protein [Nanoarchaeota archaeon]
MNNLLKIGIVAGVLFFFSIICWGMYTSLVDKQEDARLAWAQVENVLQRRHDLLPNYERVVKAYAKHEQLYIAVAEARTAMEKATVKFDAKDLDNPEKFKKFQEAQSNYQSALSRLMVVVEQYPDLKADKIFMKFLDEIAGSENRISVERMRYNKAATIYNKTIRKYLIFKDIFGFNRMSLFEASEEAKRPPVINL